MNYEMRSRTHCLAVKFFALACVCVCACVCTARSRSLPPHTTSPPCPGRARSDPQQHHDPAIGARKSCATDGLCCALRSGGYVMAHQSSSTSNSTSRTHRERPQHEKMAVEAVIERNAQQQCH
ncbi:hypothetical protein ZHAS_00020526 [Anopheles sinensis]|uniref:Secreted protein n=1 Tax=Anopheles sinensis TaxID=74873 RepID=A0A084WQ32_ANOSI|nr:hypothetical protein ZHAS_00020526 [Anopheles sinensis]